MTAPVSPRRPIPTRLPSSSRGRVAAAVGALLAALAITGALSSEARAQNADVEALEKGLALAYVAEPSDPAALRALFESLKVKSQRNFRIEAGLAIAEAAASLRDDDEAAAERAREAGEKAASLNPEHRLSKRASGLGALVAGRTAKKKRDRKTLLEKAARAFDAVAERPTPERWLDIYWKGRALLLAGDASGAEKAAGQALFVLDEGEPGALGAGDKARAKAVVTALAARAKAAAGDVGGAIEALQGALTLAPDDAALRVDLGIFLERARRREEARVELVRALDGPGSAALPARHRREAARAIGRVELVLGKQTDALRAMEPLAATSAARAEDLALRAALRRLSGDGKGAYDDVVEALVRDSFVADAHAISAELRLGGLAPNAPTTGADVVQALASARIAAALEPRSGVRVALLARALRAAGLGGEADAADARAKEILAARDALAAAGKEDPADAALREARRYLADDRAEEALEAAQAAHALDAQDGAVEVALARAHLALVPPKTAEARAAAAAVVARFPGLHGSHAIEAKASLLSGDEAAARAAAERALRLEPRDPVAGRILTGSSEAPVASGAQQARKLPPELADAAKRFQAPDPLVRAQAAEELVGDPAGADLVIGQLERDPDPFVVGALASALAAKGERRAAPTLMRMLRALPTAQAIARGRILRALGRVGDPAILPDVLGMILDGQVTGDDASHAAVISLVGGMDERGAVIFQRELVESGDALRVAMSAVLADHIAKDRLEKLEGTGGDAGDLLARVRVGLLLLASLLVYLRMRFWQREKVVETFAVAQRTRRYRKEDMAGGAPATAPKPPAKH